MGPKAPSKGLIGSDATARGSVPPLTLRTKLFYGVGAVALGLKDNGFSYLLLLFYNQVVGLPAATVGLAIMLALVVDAFLDPLIGQVSDNWRSRWGRRHPFMYFAAAPVALCYLLLWNPPTDWSEQALFLYLIVVAVLIRTFLAMFEIPSAALAPELTTDYHGRTGLLTWRAAFNWYGALIMAVLTFQVFLQPSPGHPVAQLNPGGYAFYGLVSAIVMFLAILLSALGTHDRIPYLRFPNRSAPGFANMARDMLDVASNRALLPMLAAGIFNGMAYGLGVALSLYFNTYFWGFTADQVSYFLLAQFISSALAIWLCGPLSRRLGKRNAAIVGKVVGPAFGLSPILLRLLGFFPDNDSLLLLPLLLSFHLLSVTMASVVAILHGSMSADIVEDQELKSGKRSEGLMAAANLFVAKTISGVGIFASGVVLTLAGFPAGATPGDVDSAIIINLALIYLPTMVAMHGAAIFFINRYPISGASHAATLAEIKARSEREGIQGVAVQPTERPTIN